MSDESVPEPPLPDAPPTTESSPTTEVEPKRPSIITTTPKISVSAPRPSIPNRSAPVTPKGSTVPTPASTPAPTRTLGTPATSSTPSSTPSSTRTLTDTKKTDTKSKGSDTKSTSATGRNDKCVVCQKEVKFGEGIVAKGQSFHTEHFKCCACKKDVEESMFDIQFNQVYCYDCSFSKFGATCGRCHKACKGSVIKILEKSWHDECFNCFVCHKDMSHSLTGIHNIANEPYCESCYGAVNGGNCNVCDKEIGLGDLVETLGQRFHKGCYLCCVGPHEMKVETFWKHDGKMYCQEHWEESGFVDTCAICEKMIESEYIKIGGKNYHPGCWRCRTCKKVIKDTEATQLFGDFYCATCVLLGKFQQPPNGFGKGKMVNGYYLPSPEELERMKAMHLIRGYGEYEAQPGTVPPSESPCYPLHILRLRPPKIPKEIDYRQKEQYLEEGEFQKVFRIPMTVFNHLPLWRRLMLKKEVDLF